MKTLPELDTLWAERHRAGGLAAFETELQLWLDRSPRDAHLLWRAARAHHFRAMQAGENGDSRTVLKFFEKGRLAAQKALRAEPENVGALFWVASCGLEAARERSPLATLWILPTARRRLEKAAELDAAFHYAGPLRVLGRIAHKTPPLLGGDIDEALYLYERALKLAPSHPTTSLYRAEALVDARRPADARVVLEKILAAPTLSDWVWEQERDRRRAHALRACLPN